MNCYYTDAGNFYVNSGALNVSEDILASGELCLLLNSKSDTTCWYQNIDNGEEKDPMPYPLPSHAKVYAVGSIYCDGTPADVSAYSNTQGQVTTLPHQFNEGVCTKCHTVIQDYLTPVGGYYEIKTPGELNWFARMVNIGGKNTKINAKILNDIDFSEYTSRDSVMIGIANLVDFAGTIDGMGHRITINYNTPSMPSALVKSANNAVLKNLHISGTTVCHRTTCGALASWAGHSKVINCVSDVSFTTDIEGDATIGGLIGVSAAHTVVSNCAFYGKIYAPKAVGNSGLVGWTAGTIDAIENSIVAADITVADGDNYIFARNNPTVNNCFYTDPGVVKFNPKTIEISKEQLQSGEIAFLLNGYTNAGTPWVETLGTDTVPYPCGDHSKVYAVGSLMCDGSPLEITYSNTEGSLTKADHSYDADGICQNCGSRLISTGEQLKTAAADVNSGFAQPNVSITLANDIDMSNVTDYAAIGTEDNPYSRHFDGQGHVIRNLKLISTEKHQGIVGLTNGGAFIENFTVDSSCVIKCASYAAGIVAGTASSSNGIVTVQNCGNEAYIGVDSLSGVNAAGILGVNFGGSTLLRIYNCYNAGEIFGHAECAGLSGWLGGAAEVNNCYNIGKVSGIDGKNTMARMSSDTYFVNCYESIGSQVDSVTAEQIANGALCFMLNDSVQGGTTYYQTIGADAHPVLLPSHAKVYENAGVYTNDLTGITRPRANSATAGRRHIFTSDGIEIPALKKGINIIREADGSIRKVLVK